MAEQRFEMYRPIHKVVRHAMFSTSHAIGAADFRDEESTQEAFGKLDKVITMLQAHAEHESNFVHPALESKVPGITAAFEGNHEDDERVYAQLGDLARRARGSVGDERVAWENRYTACSTSLSGTTWATSTVRRTSWSLLSWSITPTRS